MKSFSITQPKIFMQKLLTSDCFDLFLLEEGLITTYNTFIIDGRLQPQFFDKDEISGADLTFSYWKQLKPICFELIKGKRTPLNFKFVLHLSKDYTLNLPETTTLPSFIVTIKYDGTSIFLTTGTCFQTFSMDKTPENIWDQFMTKLLIDNNIPFEERI